MDDSPELNPEHFQLDEFRLDEQLVFWRHKLVLGSTWVHEAEKHFRDGNVEATAVAMNKAYGECEKLQRYLSDPKSSRHLSGEDFGSG